MFCELHFIQMCYIDTLLYMDIQRKIQNISWQLIQLDFVCQLTIWHICYDKHILVILHSDAHQLSEVPVCCIMIWHIQMTILLILEQ